jgi:hypothetical protein
MRRRTACVDLRAYCVLSSCPFGNCVHAIPDRSLEGRIGWRFIRPDGPRATSKRDTELKTLLRPMKAQKFKDGPASS